ncbi:MAG: hypothetical protein MZW92_23535 [Comamonadaceae bacterium]|nr:hypothetical protein [Comamonadaceae bacterium]
MQHDDLPGELQRAAHGRRHRQRRPDRPTSARSSRPCWSTTARSSCSAA